MTGDGARTVVVTYPGWDEHDPLTAGVLRAAGLEIRFEPRIGERSPEEVLRFMADATAGVISTDPFDRTVFAGCPRLRVLARVGVGVDTIDLDAATGAGVAVTTTPGINTTTVADHTLALILACIRRVVENDASVRSGEWDRGGRLIGTELTGATVGIVGLGAIGQAVAQRLAGFEVRILGHDVTDVEPPGIARVELEELLRAADVVTVHVPLVAGTKADRRARAGAHAPERDPRQRLSRRHRRRGGALRRAPRGAPRAGAGLDVFAREPPVGSALLDLPQVVFSPHIAGISVSAQQAALEAAVEAVLGVLAGRRPDGLINPEALALQPSGALD